MNTKTKAAKTTTVSRQVKWQRAREQAGLCRQCGKPDEKNGHCSACREKSRVASRNAYRRKQGIPISKPLLKAGRPRLSPNTEPTGSRSGAAKCSEIQCGQPADNENHQQNPKTP